MKQACIAGMLLVLSSPAPRSESKRFTHFKAWVNYYMKLTGVTQPFRFEARNHPLYCAWVGLPLEAPGFEGESQVVVGLSDPDPECTSVSVKKLALHEVCHLRYQHLLLPDMPNGEKHYEVRECMKAYEARETR